ncbi:MAG: hypothetical protein NZ585_13195 [Chloracidobacterium sp.]|nr:hypothetical protein [Chloracidobacterium sp.]MDW8218520.1 hypothetical protein [Acidobacteriota bacterium]
MLTGFNTDITYDGVVYHVQTEDKGPANPLILSLVYVGGQVLAAKRTYYTKDLEEGATPADLQKKLEKQHKAILALIARGRINELIAKRETGANVAPRPLPPPPPVPPVIAAPASVTESLSPLLASSVSEGAPARPLPASLPPPPPPPPPIPGVARVTSALDSVLPSSPEVPRSTPPTVPPPLSPSSARPAVTTVLDNLLSSLSQPPASVAPPSASTTGGTPKASIDLNSMVNQYVARNLQSEKPVITLLGNPEFYAGETVVIQAHVTRGVGGQPIPNAPVIAKVFGTHDRPYRSSASTDASGVAVLTLTLPNFHAGTAAVVISVMTDAGEAEVKHLIRRRKIG